MMGLSTVDYDYCIYTPQHNPFILISKKVVKMAPEQEEEKQEELLEESTIVQMMWLLWRMMHVAENGNVEKGDGYA